MCNLIGIFCRVLLFEVRDVPSFGACKLLVIVFYHEGSIKLWLDFAGFCCFCFCTGDLVKHW